MSKEDSTASSCTQLIIRVSGWVFMGFFLWSIAAEYLTSSAPELYADRSQPQPKSHNLWKLSDESLIIKPDGMDLATSSVDEKTPTTPKNCTTAWKSLVFIKTHKTGSTTLQTIVNRFGFYNNLSFVFNTKSSSNGHFFHMPDVMRGERPEKSFLPPLKVERGDYDNYKNYDMLSQHVRYNRTLMRRFMRRDTKYITIIREPSAQWESAFDHFMFYQAFGKDYGEISRMKWLATFLEKPSYYREKLRFKSYHGLLGLHWYYAQDGQMYDLGLAEESYYNETVINATIKSLTDDFTLVLITDHFDESLLVLKRELCWEYEDIVFVPQNQRQDRPTLSAKIRRKIREFNHADVLLYDHFNKTLWRKIEEYGPSFQADLMYFQDLKSRLFEQCANDKPNVMKMSKISNHIGFSAKKHTTLFCRTLVENKRLLFNMVYNRQKNQKRMN